MDKALTQNIFQKNGEPSKHSSVPLRNELKYWRISDVLRVATYLNMYGGSWLHDRLEGGSGSLAEKADIVGVILSDSHDYFRER